MSIEPPLLKLSELQAWYSESHVLHGVDLSVYRGETVALLGRNGAGKSTTIRSIMGMIGRRSGSILYDGIETIALTSDRIARRGLAICPEERGIFSALTVHENLVLPPVIAPGGLTLDEIFTLFPNLKERAATLGTKLSGGEQQMLAIARILRTGATCLLLDEPSEGLAPAVIGQIARAIATLKTRGYTLLVVEQNFTFARSIADRFYVMEDGKIVDMVTRTELARDEGRLDTRLRV